MPEINRNKSSRVSTLIYLYQDFFIICLPILHITSWVLQNKTYIHSFESCKLICCCGLVIWTYKLELKSSPHCLLGPRRKNLLSAFDTIANWLKADTNLQGFTTTTKTTTTIKTTTKLEENCITIYWKSASKFLLNKFEEKNYNNCGYHSVSRIVNFIKFIFLANPLFC